MADKEPTAAQAAAPEKPSGPSGTYSDDAHPHPKVGLKAERGCTDVFGWLLLIIAVGLTIATANTAFKLGKPMRMILGTDYLGNICGEMDPAPENLTITDWADRKLVWYPLTFDFKTKKLLVTEALKLGICVKSCPAPGTTVKPYGTVGSTPPPPWLVLFNSTPTFHRCMPSVFTFDCQGDDNCLKYIATSNSTFNQAAALGNFANGAMDEIRTNFWTIYSGVGIAILLCFIWMMLLRRILTTFVKLSLFLVFVLLIGTAVLCMQLRTAELNKAEPNESTADWFLAGMIAGFAFSFGYLILMYFIWRDVIIACDIIEEATRVPVDIPSMIALPPGTLIFVLLFASFAVVLAVFIQSCGENLDFTIPVPNFLNTSNPSTASLTNISGSDLANINFNESFTATDIHFPNWRPYAHVYNLFFFLWMFGLMNAICFMTISLCTVFWYFSNPGDEKKPPFGAVVTGFHMSMRYHLGTLALGTMIVAIIQTIRIVLLVLEQKMKEAAELNDATKCMFKMAQCCLGCLQWIVEFINKNAYIMCAIEGTNFFTSAKNALTYIGHNAMSVGALTAISTYVILFGKIIITCGTVIASYFIIQAGGAGDGISGGVILLFIIGILSFFISCLFANVFSVCIDTMLMCYCWDRDNRDIDYFPSDLAKHVEAMQSRKAGSVDPGPDKKGDGALAVPMKETGESVKKAADAGGFDL